MIPIYRNICYTEICGEFALFFFHVMKWISSSECGMHISV
jgi:hypothetical protein